jgi:hypothetical protein
MKQQSKKEEEREELRWIDPDEWGRLAWATLFGAATTVVDARRLSLWRRLMSTLPKILPCFSCRHCCENYLIKNPITDRLDDVLPWLGRLRLDVRARNRRDGDVTPAQALLQDQHWPETVAESQRRFLHRLAFPSLWYTDAWLFLASVCVVANWSKPESRTAIHEFVQLMWALSPLPFDWSVPEQKFTTLNEAVKWLLTGDRAKRNQTAWLSILSRMPVRSRTVVSFQGKQADKPAVASKENKPS